MVLPQSRFRPVKAVAKKPDRWALLLKWDKDSAITFHADGHTVHDLDYRFQCGDEGLVPKDKTFRWGMLDAVQLRFF